MLPKSSIIYDIMPHSSVKVDLLLEGTYRFHLQGRRTGQVRNRHEAGSRQSLLNVMNAYERFSGDFACCSIHAGILLGLPFDREEGGCMFLRNVC
jgi:hypothetical protein